MRVVRTVGLTMTVNVQQYEYVKEAGDTAGIIVVILPQHQMPFPEDEGTMISPGHATSIAIVQVPLQRLHLPCNSAGCVRRSRRQHVSQIQSTVQCNRWRCINNHNQSQSRQDCQALLKVKYCPWIAPVAFAGNNKLAASGE